MHGLSLLASFLLLTQALAQPSGTIPPTIPVKVGVPTPLRFETDALSVTVVCLDPAIKFANPKDLASAKLALVVAQKKGSYEAVVILIGKDGLYRQERTQLVAEEEKPQGEVKKDPVLPGPVIPITPPPAPTVKLLRIVVIEATGEATLARQKELDRGAINDLCEARGHKRLVLDKNLKDGAPPDLDQTLLKNYLTYINAAEGKELPWLFIVPATGGKALYNGPILTGDALVNKVKELEGK